MASPSSSSPPAAAASRVRFPEEHGIVLDRWLHGVCGSDDRMQFPAHRRAQYPSYAARCEQVSKTKTFLAGTFPYGSRSGLAEVSALQALFEQLGGRERAGLAEQQRLAGNAAQVRRVLSDKTMGASELLSPTAATANANGGSSGRLGASVGQQQQPQQGYTALDDSSTAAEEYTQRSTIAARYTAELAATTAAMRSRRAAMEDRHRALLEEKHQVDNEYKALETTEEIVVGRQEETARRMEEETEGLATERRQWAALKAGEPLPPDGLLPPPPLDRKEGAAPDEVGPSAPLCGSSTSDEARPVPADEDGEEEKEDTSLPGSPSPSPFPGQDNEPPPQQQHQQTLARTLELLEPSVASGEEERGRQGQLESLRAQLGSAGAALADLRRQLRNGEQVHAGRFKQSRQRLRDWQDMTAAARRTHGQLTGQMGVLATIVRDTADRVAAASAAASGAGYADQLYRLNSLLAERSGERLRSMMGDSATGSPTLNSNIANAAAAGGAAAFTAEVRPLGRPAPTPGRGGGTGDSSYAATPIRGGNSNGNGNGGGDFSTPQRQYISVSSAVGTPTAAAATGGGQQQLSAQQPGRHRSRYDLVRHLQRWEVALQTERALLLEAAGLTASERTTGENPPRPPPGGPLDARMAHLRQRVLKLQKMLLIKNT